MTTTTSYYEPLSRATLKDPAQDYPLLHAARVLFQPDANPALYVLSRYEDVRDALSNTGVFSSAQGNRPRPTLTNGLQSDPPAHTGPRTFLQTGVADSLSARVQDSAAVKAANLLSSLKARAHWDLHDDFALPLSISVLGTVIGIPADELELFQYYGETHAAASLTQDPGRRDSHWSEDLQDFSEYLLNKIIATRQAAHRSGVIGSLIAASETTGEITDYNILNLVNHLLAEGLETSATMVTNALWRVLPDRRVWQELDKEPGRMQLLIDESLRFDPPTLAVFRTTTQANSDYGTEIPRGARVMLHLGAANRDPTVFEEPNRFDLDRPATQHVTFGFGIHYCLGARVARTIAHIALASLHQQCPQLSLRGQGERTEEFFQWGRRRLPVTTKAAGG